MPSYNQRRLFLYSCMLSCSSIAVAANAAEVQASDATDVDTQNVDPKSEPQEDSSLPPGPKPSVQDQGTEAAPIVITGSRIRRSNATAAIPVQILGEEDVREVGSVDVGEILREIPGVDASLSPENSNTIFQNSGLSTVNLRRLGGNRSLTLIDGRRAVSNSGNGERVSLNTIPAGFVRRVEVTTGGASAIYGSDAIAGVANVILRDNFEGIDFNARLGKAQRSGEREFTVDLTGGTRFADDRGYILLGLSYNRETAIFADETRPESIANLEFNRPNRSRLPGEEDNPDAFGSELGFGDCDNSGRFCINPSGSTFLPGGIFEGDDAWNIGGVWFNDQSLLPQDGRLGAFGHEPDSDGFNFRPGRVLSTPIRTIATAVKADFEISPAVSVFLDLNYSEIKTSSVSTAQSASNFTDIGIANALGDIGNIAADHPFIPPEVEETRFGTVSWRRRFSEVGRSNWISNRKTLRSAFGLEGTLGDTWEWTAYGTYGRYEQDQTYENQLNYLNIQNALRIEADGNGGFQCVDADARGDGCVPLNIFGEGSISSAAADYIRYTGTLNQVREQVTVASNLNGELFDFGTGAVKASFGVEYRSESQDTVGDADNATEYTSVPIVPDISASFNVKEAFAELDIPIIDNKLSLQLAARIADYSTVGRVVSYNIGGSWQPIDDIRFRAQFSRSQRAPTLTEFFSPPRGDFNGLLDPCNGLNADGTGITPAPGSTSDAGTISANCLSEPGIQAFFADPVNAGEPFRFSGTIFSPNQGNANLREETATTFTAGVILQPSFLPGFSLVADYYNIRIKDAIGSLSAQTTADLCYGDTSFPANRFCDVITRDATGGRIIELVNLEENLNRRASEGVDVTLNYRFELPVIPGRFDTNVIFSHYFKNETSFLSVAGPETRSFLGVIGAPKNEFRARLGWRSGNFRVSWVARYRQGGVNDVRLDPTDDAYFKIGGRTYHNLYTHYTLRNNPRVRLFAGINNVTNDLGPLLPTGIGSTRNIGTSMNSLAGREFYGGVRVRW